MSVQYEPIKPAYILAGGDAVPAQDEVKEKASQTFKRGVPLKLNGGFLDEVTFSAADIIYGVSREEGHNLDADGTAQELSEGTPPNQPSAKKIPVGARIRSGKVGVYLANSNTVFSIMLKDGQTFSDSLVINPGTLYGLTKDGTSGFWFIDTTVTAGNSAVAQIIGVDPESPNTVAAGARVYFQFGQTKRVFQ